MASRKRRRYIVKRTFQIKYIGIILFFMFLTALISCGVTYFAIFPMLSEKLASVYPQGRLLMIMKDVNTKILFSTGLLLPVAAWFGIMLSHRFAGPWHRLEGILEDMAEGNLTKEIKLRKWDDLQSLADAINDITNNLHSYSLENQQSIQVLDDTLKEFEQELAKEPVDVMKTKLLISKIQDVSSELKELLKKHKLG